MRGIPFIALRKSPWRADVCDPQAPYEVICRGNLIGVVYWRSSGYGGFLPTPEGRLKPIHGLDAKQLRDEVKRTNLEFFAPCPIGCAQAA